MRYAQTNVQLYEQLADRELADLVAVRDAYQLAMELFTSRFRACGRPFVCHLVGTASILARHGATIDVTVAGLVHAAYEQGDFGVRGAGLASHNRARVREAIGPHAEALVARYQQTPGTTWESVPPQELAPILQMRMANELDEHIDRRIQYAGIAQEAARARGAKLAAAGRACGFASLADELEAATDDARPVPAPLTARQEKSFTLHPPLRSVWRARWRALRKRGKTQTSRVSAPQD